MAKRSTQQQYALYAALAALLVFLAIIFFLDPSNWYLVWLAVWSITAFGFYGYDKMQAKRGAWRVPEVVLLGLSIIGGFAGSLLGMIVFRHKTTKTLFWLTGIAGAVLHGFVYVQFVR